jgi:hypothetical protein
MARCSHVMLDGVTVALSADYSDALYRMSMYRCLQGTMPPLIEARHPSLRRRRDHVPYLICIEYREYRPTSAITRPQLFEPIAPRLFASVKDDHAPIAEFAKFALGRSLADAELLLDGTAGELRSSR